MKIILTILIGLSLALPVYGQSNTTFPSNPATKPLGDDGGQGGTNNPQSSFFQIVTCNGVDDPRTKDKEEIECDYKQLINMVSRLIQFVLYLLIPIVLGMILFVGFKYLTANGDSSKLADAKRMIKPLLLGVFLIFAAWFLVYTVLDRFLADNVSGVPKGEIIPQGGIK